MAIDKFGSPYAIADESLAYSTPDTAGSAVSSMSTTPGSGVSQGLSDADASSLGGAGVGAAATTAKAILDSIAAQNTLHQNALQGQYNRQNTAAENANTRSTESQIGQMHTERGAEDIKNKAGSTKIDAMLGGQAGEDTATSGVVDRLAQLMSGNTKKRFGA